MSDNGPIITPITDFDEYAPPDAAQAYKRAIDEYIAAYHKVFSLPISFCPNDQAIHRLFDAAQRITSFEMEHCFRTGYLEGKKAL